MIPTTADLGFAEKHVAKGHSAESAEKIIKRLRKTRPKLAYTDPQKEANFRHIAIMEQIRDAAAAAAAAAADEDEL